jgi:hypothetical protein
MKFDQTVGRTPQGLWVLLNEVCDTSFLSASPIPRPRAPPSHPPGRAVERSFQGLLSHERPQISGAKWRAASDRVD